MNEPGHIKTDNSAVIAEFIDRESKYTELNINLEQERNKACWKNAQLLSENSHMLLELQALREAAQAIVDANSIDTILEAQDALAALIEQSNE